MSFAQPGKGPTLMGINLLSGAGSQITDPAGLWTPPPSPETPASVSASKPWVGPSQAQQAAAAAAGSGKAAFANQDETPSSTLGSGDKEKA